MRLFVADPVPDELKGRLAALGMEIAQEGLSVVKPQNMHLTLKFLGETRDTELKTIEKRLAGVRFAPFQCELKGVGVFPS